MDSEMARNLTHNNLEASSHMTGTKVQYKPDGSNNEYFIYVDRDLMHQYRQTPGAVEPIDVVEVWSLWVHVQGADQHPSKSNIAEDFDGGDISDAIKIILDKGKIHGEPKYHRHEQDEPRSLYVEFKGVHMT